MSSEEIKKFHKLIDHIPNIFENPIWPRYSFLNDPTNYFENIIIITPLSKIKDDHSFLAPAHIILSIIVDEKFKKT